MNNKKTSKMTPGEKAAKTRAINDAASPAKSAKRYSAAAKKAWKTRRQNEA